MVAKTLKNKRQKKNKTRRGGGYTNQVLKNANSLRVKLLIDKGITQLTNILENIKKSKLEFGESLTINNKPYSLSYSGYINSPELAYNNNTKNENNKKKYLKNRRRYHNYLVYLTNKLTQDSRPIIQNLMNISKSMISEQEKEYNKIYKEIKGYRFALLNASSNSNDYVYKSGPQAEALSNERKNLNKIIKEIDVELLNEEKIPLPDYGDNYSYDRIFGF